VYGKVFDSIYTGTLYGHWEAIVTFQQMIVLCDADGIVDMTPQGICGRTSIPLEIIVKGIEVLSAPDPYTRTPGSGGRRIELIDSHRPWGWRIINHNKYKKLQDADMLRAQTAERVRKHRELKRLVTDGNGQKRHTDTDTDTDKNLKTLSGPSPDATQPKNINGHHSIAKSLLSFLNEKTGRNYQPVKANLDMIAARLKEGATERQCRLVILRKFHDWGSDEKMAEYLRPATLFNRTKFAQYAGEIPKESTDG